MSIDLGYDPTKFMQNADGHLVPVESVSELDKLKDELIEQLLGKAAAESEQLARLKAEAMGDILGFAEVVAEKYGAKFGGKEGNLSLVSFDGMRKVAIAVNKTLEIDEANLLAAKSLIDECLTEWAQDSRPELKVIITEAFKTDGKGRVNTKSILALLKLKIEDKRWKSAMQALRDGLHSDGKKTYVRFHKRTGTDNAWETISLDISKL